MGTNNHIFEMNYPSSMQIGFEREKNLKAAAITSMVCLLLFLLFFYLQWTMPAIPIPTGGEGIEVNLGNSETGLGDIAPAAPGEPAIDQQDQSQPSPAISVPNNTNIITDENGDEPVNTPTKAPSNIKPKPEIPATKPVLKKPAVHPVVAVPSPPKPKAVFKGGSSNSTGGNGADSYNGVKDQGIAGGKGDQGNPNGNPNSDSYTGNAASGNGGNGVSIRSGLDGRRISRLPSFQDDFNENAKVAIDITVDQSGNVISASVNPKGTTTTNQHIRNIALQKARSLKLNAGNDPEQSGTIVFSFKLRG